MTVPLPLLLGERAAAEYLGISTAKLRELRLQGLVRRRRLGRRRLYDRRDLDLLADSLPYEEAEEQNEAEEWLAANA